LNAKPLIKTLIVGSLLLLASCAEKVIEPPEDLIPTDKMTEILYDLSLLNAASSIGGNALKEKGIETMPYLFEKYGIDSLQFVTSDQYYASIPLTYEAIYKDIQTRLEKEVEQIETARKQRSDSIREQANILKDSLPVSVKETSPAAVPSKK